MKLTDLGEFGLIGQIEKMLKRSAAVDRSVNLGIGDDAAVLLPRRNKSLIATVDCMIESSHFDLRYNDLRSVGWKAAAMNFSDIAAMGGIPRWMLVNLAVTEKMTLNDIRELYRGMTDCANRFNVRIVGGNTAKSNNELSVTVTVLGDCPKKKQLQRNGARPDDVIVLTGYPGLSAAGLQLLKSGKHDACRTAIRKQLRPVPRVDEIQTLLKNNIRVNACIDVSDGLAADLRHVCDASDCGALLQSADIPFHADVKKTANFFSADPYENILHGGEDYELLMTMKESEFLKAKKHLPELTRIGVMTREKGIRISDAKNKISIIHKTGFRHF